MAEVDVIIADKVRKFAVKVDFVERRVFESD